MTIEPISDDRLAEIRAGLEGADGFDRVQYFARTILAILARLDKAEADAATARGLLSSLLNGDGPAVVPSPNPTA